MRSILRCIDVMTRLVTKTTRNLLILLDTYFSFICFNYIISKYIGKVLIKKYFINNKIRIKDEI